MPKSKNAASKISSKAVRNKDGTMKKYRKALFSKKTAPASGGVKKASQKTKKDGTLFKERRNKAGTVALREIRKYQKATHNFFPRASF